MAISVKREILGQLKRIGLHFERSMLRVMPTQEMIPSSWENVGRTFYIDLPGESSKQMVSVIEKINSSLIKVLQRNSNLIENVEIRVNEEDNRNRLLFQIDFKSLIGGLFNDLHNPNLISERFSNDPDISNDFRQKIIVEYSSPNIAKPFHVGNLRSTIIGNSIANILKFKGHQIWRMNYLGDWGTQFGILSLAYDQFGDEEKLKSEPLKHLLDVYVRGNQECESNDQWRNEAKERFHQLELKHDPHAIEQWSRFRELSLTELERLYQRIGVQFDVYASESMYSRCTESVIELLKKAGLLEMIDGAAYANVEHYDHPEQKIQIPLVKKDGTSLYLTRDIAAVIHRKEQFEFDRMYYVVDNSQAKHFTHLKSIFFSLGDPLYRAIKHLKFGRIIGMSTRKGDAIFLDQVLDEAKNRALEAIKSSPNTKILPEHYDDVADILGVSAVIIQDLAHRRVSEYRFNWNRALKLNGDTGISLQYTHARLCNLIKNCGLTLSKIPETGGTALTVNVSAIDSPEGRALVNHLIMFDEIIDLAHDQLEPSIITHYIFELKTAINRAHQELTIKGQPTEISETRLLLFQCSKNVLAECMRLLGLRPLESM